MIMVLLFAALGMCAACGIVVATLGLNSHVLARGTADDAMVWSPMSSPAADPPMRAQLTRPFESVAERISERSERKGNPTLAEHLLRADLKLRIGEFVLLQVGFAVAFGLLGLLRYGFGAQFIVSAVGAYLIPMRYVKFRQNRRMRRFNEQLADTLTLLANALKAGHSFPQALDTVARNTSPPIADEFARVVREMNIGRSPEQALANALRRMPSDDLELILTAVSIHSQVGGNLARVFDNVSHTIRERVRVKGKISALTAQARMSGWIITLLPVALGLFLYVIAPSYFGGMLREPLGWALVVVAAVSIICGNAIIRRIVAIKV